MRPKLNNIRSSRKRRPRRPRAMVFLLLALFASVLSVTALPANAATPTCQTTTSDSDGDGWGWENNRSCRVEEQSGPNTDLHHAPYLHPVCHGGPWCTYELRPADTLPTRDTHDDRGRPYCQKPWSDSDGDGWGWENGRSCVMPDIYRTQYVS